MTSKLKHLVDLAHDFASRGHADERVDVVILRGQFSSREEQRAWMELRESPPSSFEYIQIYDVAISGDIRHDEHFSSTRGVTINIKKVIFNCADTFLFQDGVVAYLKENYVDARQILCAELDGSSTFRARGLVVGLWDANRPAPLQTIPNAIDPRPYVRDLVPGQEIACDITPWILEVAPKASSTIYKAWQSLGARKLFGALVDTASIEDGRLCFSILGPPRWKDHIDNLGLDLAYSYILKAAIWVYCSGEDKEVRHLLCSAEISRASRPHVGIDNTIELGLQSAKAAYEAHVQSSSRETLKALADLRKTIIEDTQKITERARGLSSDLWKDVAVTSAPFVVKQLQDTSSATNHSLQAAFYFGAALFIMMSFWIQTRINSAFFEDQERARDGWLEALYKYVSMNEKQRIAVEPINDAIRNYQGTKNIIASIYFLLVFVLILSGMVTLRM